MKLIPKPMARRRTAIAALRSLGGPQIPSPVRRMAPKPRRLTVSSPPKSIVPQSAADRLVAFSLMFFLQRRSFVRYRLVYSAACQCELLAHFNCGGLVLPDPPERDFLRAGLGIEVPCAIL